MAVGYLQLKEDEDDAGDGESPGGDHEEPVPDEPLVELAALGAGPGLLEVAREEHADGGEEHPRADHEGPVQLHLEVLVGGQLGHGAEILRKDCINKLLLFRQYFILTLYKVKMFFQFAPIARL